MNPKAQNQGQLSALDRFMCLFSDMRAREGKSVLLLFSMAFLFLFSSYLLKPVRETLILTSGDAEQRSYAIAVQAVLLLIIIPLYGLLFKRTNKQQLMQIMIGLCIGFILFFYLLFFVISVQAPFAFYIWLGLFGVLIIAQFWAFASDLYNEDAGKRLFAIIALGASAGAWMGSGCANNLMAYLGAEGLMLLAALVLTTAWFIVPKVEASIPESCRAVYSKADEQLDPHLLSSFKLVAQSRYLMAIAIFVVLFNWINSIGDFVMSAWVVTLAEESAQLGSGVDKSIYIGEFYSKFYLYVNLAGFLIQALLVSRIIRFTGVSVAVTILPLIMLFSYVGVYFFPVFSLFYSLRIIENSMGYSLQNTLRQILFLPTSKQAKYEGRSVIETFFWRLGDVFQGVSVYIGFNVIKLDWSYFIMLNIVLTIIVLLMVLRIGYHYRGLIRQQKVLLEK